MPFSYTTACSRWEPLESTSWQDFHAQWWGDAGETRLRQARASRLVQVEQGEVCAAIRLLTDTAGDLYLRDEILLMYERLVWAFSQDSDGVVYAGSPACGKSYALLYVLLSRMAAECPVLFSTTDGTSFFFDSKGVWSLASNDIQLWPMLDDIRDSPSGRFWSLIDYDTDSTLNPDRNLMFKMVLFPVHAVRHERQRYNHWLNHCYRASVLLMDPWSTTDLFDCLELQTRFNRLADGIKASVASVLSVVELTSRSGASVVDVLQELEQPGHHQTAIETALRPLRAQDLSALVPQVVLMHAKSALIDALFVARRRAEPVSDYRDFVELCYKSPLAKKLFLEHLCGLGCDRSRIEAHADQGPKALLKARTVRAGD